MAPLACDSAPSGHPSLLSDERREWVRIDDQLLLEYRLTTDSPDRPVNEAFRATQESITASIAKPTADLLARADEVLSGSPLIPWLKKIDWLLEVMLKSLATIHPQGISMAQVKNVNISGGGISFITQRELRAGQSLVLKFILPPFTPIETTARIIRVTPSGRGEEGFCVATQFEAIKADDQEALIRHILLAQAERLRARRSAGG